MPEIADVELIKLILLISTEIMFFVATVACSVIIYYHKKNEENVRIRIEENKLVS